VQNLLAQLPRWVEFGAFILAMVAGYVNVVGLLGFEHQSVSHLSGTATLFGASLINAPLNKSLILFGVLISFLIGSVISGWLLHAPTLKLGRHYDTALVIEFGLLIITAYLLTHGKPYGHFFASAACGLQNAMATTYSNAIIRTTHITGIFTDLGIMFGSFLRGEPLDSRKLKLFICIILGFILGGVLGAVMYAQFEYRSLYVPALSCLVLAMSYKIYNLKRDRENDKEVRKK
jgi:uncharacterized membrane protein YoaK (UPF0700 family)